MAVQGFKSLFLPLNQGHGTGRVAYFDVLRGDLHRGPMWTDESGGAGDLLFSPWQQLSAGDYTAVLQIWHHGEGGSQAGSLIAETDAGQLLSQKPIVTREIEFGDWQRDLLHFRLDQQANARVRLRYDGGTSLWTGALYLMRSGLRPIHIIGHNRNTPAAVDRSLAAGASSIEGDFSYREGKLLVAETPPYRGWMETSEPAPWLAHLQSRQNDWGFIYFDCKLVHVPDNNFYRFGQELCGLIRHAGVGPERCLFSVGDASAIDLFRAAADSGFGSSAVGMDGLNGGSPEHASADFWPQQALQHHLQSIGLGRASLQITHPVAQWLSVVESTVCARDSGAGAPTRVVFWTLEDKGGMRKVLDMGVDAIIAEREDRLCEVLNEEPYRSFCRRANPSERDLFHIYGAS